MPHTIKLAAQHYAGLKPQNRADRKSLVQASAYVACATAVAVGLWLAQQHWQQVRELTWDHAPGTILKVKPVLVSNGTYSLYEAQFLVSYSDNGATKQRWIAIRQTPKSLGEIDMESVRWTGATCTVRWNPSHPDQADIEFS